MSISMELLVIVRISAKGLVQCLPLLQLTTEMRTRKKDDAITANVGVYAKQRRQKKDYVSLEIIRDIVFTNINVVVSFAISVFI